MRTEEAVLAIIILLFMMWYDLVVSFPHMLQFISGVIFGAMILALAMIPVMQDVTF